MRNILELTPAGIAKLEQHLVESGNQIAIPFCEAVSNLIEVVMPQINNPDSDLSVAPWYFAVGVAGAICPSAKDEHETSDYEEICFSYGEADFIFEKACDRHQDSGGDCVLSELSTNISKKGA